MAARSCGAILYTCACSASNHSLRRLNSRYVAWESLLGRSLSSENLWHTHRGTNDFYLARRTVATKTTLAVECCSTRKGLVGFRCVVRNFGETAMPVITLFTKRHTPCSLCDDAKEKLAKYSELVKIEECYIDEEENKDWRRLYQYDIPVIHINGKFLMKHRVNEDLLEQELGIS